MLCVCVVDVMDVLFSVCIVCLGLTNTHYIYLFTALVSSVLESPTSTIYTFS